MSSGGKADKRASWRMERPSRRFFESTAITLTLTCAGGQQSYLLGRSPAAERSGGGGGGKWLDASSARGGSDAGG